MAMGLVFSSIGRRCCGSVVLVLFLLLQAMPLAASWSGPSLEGMECCRRKANAHSCCKRQSKEPVIRSENSCGSKCCCAVPSVQLSVRYSVVLPQVRPLPVAVAVEPIEAPEPRTRPTPGYSLARFQRPPPVA